MAAPKFCSECGERLKAARANPSRLFRAQCARCAPRSGRLLVIFISVPLLCAAALGFVAGRYTAKPEPFQFIGTPIEPGTDTALSSGKKPDSSSDPSAELAREPVAALPRAPESLCGARTISGKPCRRKVKLGGYCWQHREKFGEKKVKSRNR